MIVKMFFAGLVVAMAGALFFANSASAASLIFPVLGKSSYSNDYKSPRGNVAHGATDIIAKKGQQVVSATDGIVYYVEYPQRGNQGYMVVVRSTGGNYYYYIHLNNDNEGKDDGRGGGMKAYAPDIKKGNPIKRGQLLGWVGDSGNAENTVSHLHFEIRSKSPDGPTINPYPHLKKNSVRISKPIKPPAMPHEILPYSGNYTGAVNVARGDIDGDGKEDIVAGAEGKGKSSLIRVFNEQTNQYIAGVLAQSSSLKFGVDVAVGDVFGSHENEIVAAYTDGSKARAGIYSYDAQAKSIKKLKDFVIYGGSSAGKTMPRVSVGDVNGDGKAEIITGTGSGTTALLRVFSANGDMLESYKPVGSFTGGIDVAAGNIATTTGDEIILAPLTRGSSRVRVYSFNSANNSVVYSHDFYAYGPDYRGGLRLSIGEIMLSNPGFEIVTSPNNGARSVFRAISPAGKTLYRAIVLEEWWRGYYDVAASRDGSTNYSFATGQNRRGSIR